MALPGVACPSYGPDVLGRLMRMDRETRHEFDRLLRGFDEALFEVRTAGDDEHTLSAWRHVQMLGHELNALLPAVESYTLSHG